MPDFSGPIQQSSAPAQSSITLQDIIAPKSQPGVNFITSSNGINGSISEADMRQSLLGQGRIIDSNAGKAPVYGIKSSYAQAERYDDPNLGYSPLRDNEDLYAQNQGVLGSIGAGLGRFALTSVTKLGTGLGYIAGLATSAFDPAGRSRYGDGISAWLANAGDNAFSYQFDKMEQSVKNDLLPIYQDAADKNKGFFMRAATDLNFWTEDVSDGAAFMASALFPGFVISKAGVGTKLLQGLAKFSKAENIALDATEAANLFGGSVKAGATAASGELQYVPKLLKIASNARAARSIDVGLQTVVSTASEAMFEASETKKNIYDKLVSSGISNEEAAKQAAIGARDTYLMNLGALAFSNLWEANLIFKKLPSTSTEALGAATRDGLFGITSIESRGLLHELPKTAVEGFVTEGLYEENVQLAIQRMNELAYSPSVVRDIESGKRKPYTFGEKLKGVALQTAKQTVDAIMGNDPEAAMNIGIGGLIGIGAGGISQVRQNFSDEKYRQKVESTLNSYGAAFRSLKDVYNSDGTLNEDALVKVAASQNNVLELMDLVDLAEDKQLPVLKSIYESELFSQFANAHFQNGQGDLLQEKLDNVANLKSEDLQALGFDAQNTEGIGIKIQELKRQATQLQGLYDNIQKNVIGNDPKIVQFRKDEAFRLGARSITLSQQAARVQNELNALNSGGENLSVSELNQRVAKVKAAQSFVEGLESDNALQEGTSNSEWIEGARADLQTATKDLEDFKKNNEQSLLTAKEDQDGFYNTDQVLDDVLTRANRRKAQLKLAEIQLSKNSVDQRFNKIANPSTGNNFTRKYYDKIVNSQNPKPTPKSLGLDTVTTPQYQQYEASRLRRQRIQSSVNDIERQFRSELLAGNIDNANLNDLLSLIDQSLDRNVTYSQEDKSRITTALSNSIDEEINNLSNTAKNYRDIEDRLGSILPEDMLPEEEDEYMFAVNELPKVQNEIDNLNALKDRASQIGIYTPSNPTEDTFRRQIAEEYFVEPQKIVSDIQQSGQGYDSATDLDNVDNQIKQLENLKQIFSEREDTKSSDEFKGFNDRISTYINELKDARSEIERRVADRSVADDRALNNHVNILGQSVGININDGTVTPVNTIISEVLNSSYPTESSNLNAALITARETKDNKKILYVLESIQALVKKATKENPQASKKFNENIETLKQNILAEFVKQPGLAQVKVGNISENEIEKLYSKNPANVFKYIVTYTLSNKNYDLERKDSPIYKYLQNLNITELLNNAKQDNREGQSLSKDDFISLIQNHIAYLSVDSLEKSINSDISLTEEVENELNTINKSITESAKQEPNTDITVQTPSNEQLISLRQLVNFLFTKPSKIAFSNWAYLKGSAGTGKSQIISKWLLKLAKISAKDVFAIGHTETSSANINSLIGKEGIAPSVEELIEALDGNNPIKLILIDEIGGFDSTSILAVQEALDKYNSANNTSLKVITLGDPNQLNVNSRGELTERPAIETVQYKNNPPFEGKLNNINVISPLTIRFRSDVSQITNFSDKFINQGDDLSSKEMIVTSNNPELDQNKLQNTDLLGVVGTKNFSGTIGRILPTLVRKQDGRSRAIITTPAKIESYREQLRQANIPLTDVEVLSYVDAQGRTIDEVYVDIPNSKSDFKNNTIYNKAMYVATSRATSFILVSNYNTQNEVDNSITNDIVSKKTAISNSANEFKNDRTQELETLNNFVKIDTDQKVTQVDSEPETTKSTVDQTNIEESVEDEEENPAPIIEESQVEDAEQQKETEISVNFDENTIHTLKFPTSEAATNIVIHEGAVTPSYISNRALASLSKKGIIPEMRNRATAVGDKVFYMPSINDGNLFFVLMTPLKDSEGKLVNNRYRQLGVISDEELDSMKDNPDLESLHKILMDYKADPNARALQIDLDRNEITIQNPISVAEGTVGDIDYINFTYGQTPRNFSLNEIVNKFASGLYGKDKDLAKKIQQIKNNAKVIIYKASDNLPSENIIPGAPYLVLSNLGESESTRSKKLYIQLSGRTLNEKDHKDYVAPIKEFVNVIEKLNSLIGDGNFVYGNAVFENAIIKIARRNKTGEFEVADRTINVTKEILNLTRKADVLHLKPTASALKIGSKVKYANPELNFTSVRVHTKTSEKAGYKKGDKYEYKSPGEVAEIETGIDPNTDKESVQAVKVRYFQLDENGETKEVVTDFIPIVELSSTQTENGKAQVALNNLWKGNESSIRGSNAFFVEDERPIREKNGEIKNRRTFSYPSILRSESTNAGFNKNALSQLKAIVNFDEKGNHKESSDIPKLRVPVPRNTSNINFTNAGNNSINDEKITSTYLESRFESVSPTRVSVVIGNRSIGKTESGSKIAEQKVAAPKLATQKINIPRGRRLSGTSYDASQLGENFSKEQARKFIASKLPELSKDQLDERVKFVDSAQMMRITGGLPAWGYFVDNLIYLQTNPDDTVKENAVRHEVAHYVFNNYLNSNERSKFISEIKKENPSVNFMTNDEVLEYVDEYIAEKYQNYKPASTVSSFIKGIIRKIAKFLGFATPFIRNLNDYFDAIDQGIFSSNSEEQLMVGRPLLSVKEHFGGSTDKYLTAHEIFSSLVDHYTNPSEPIVEDEDGNLTNVPLTREEAISKTLQYIKDRKFEYDQVSDKSTLSPEDLSDYDVFTSLSQRNNKGRYFVFEELVKDFYPNYRFIKIPGTDNYQALETNKAFDFNYESTEDYETNLEDSIPSGEDDEVVAGNEGWLDDQDTINPLKKASQAVKDFMSSMTVKIGNGVERIRPGYVFYKLLQNLSGIDVNDLPEGNEVRSEINQIKANFEYNGLRAVDDESNRDWVIYNKISNLLNQSNLAVDEQGRRLPINSYFQWRGDNQKGYYEFVHNNKFISSLTKGNKKPTDQFFKDIHTETRLPYETIKALYQKKEAADSINSIYQVINSMRAKSPMFGEYEWKWGRDKKQSIKRKYGVFKDEASLAAAKSYVSNILASRYPVLNGFKQILSERKGLKNKVSTAKTILTDLGMIPNANSVYIGEDQATYLLNSFDAIAKLAENIGQQTGINPEENTPIIYDAQEFVSDLKQYVSRIAKIINSRKTEVGRSSSYIGGDGKPRWFFMNSTQAFDTFRKIIEQRPLRGFLTNPATIFKYNIFNPNSDNKLSSIYSLRDHDSVGEIDSQRDPVLYRRELTKDFIDRNFIYGFINFLSDSTTQGYTYLQQFYTISNKPNMLTAQVDVLSHDKLKDVIKQAIVQEANRSPKGISNYDDNIKNRVTYLVGLEQSLTPEEALIDKNVNIAVDKVYTALQERAAESFEKYMSFNPILDKNFTSVFYKLNGAGFIDPKLAKEAESVEDISKIKGNFRWETLSNEEDRNEFRKAVLPVFDLFYKNYFVNSIFLNQLSSGDQAQYKNEYDEIKRMSMAFAIGYRGRVNDETGLRRSYNVATTADFRDTIGNDTFIGKTFSRLLGASYDLTDAQGFMTPERATNIRKGFSREANLGATMKPVYFGIDNNGVARGVKYSTVELTNELVATFPELAELRYQMTFGQSEYQNDPETRNLYQSYIKNTISNEDIAKYENRANEVINNGNHVDELIFDSAFKVGKPLISSNWKTDNLIKPESIVKLTNDNYRHQLNPRHDSDTKTSNPSQLTYQINTNGKNFARLSKVLNLNALMYNYGLKSVMGRLFPNGDMDNRAARIIRQTIAEPLAKVPGNERYAEFIQDPEISLNLPNITNKLQQSFLAYVSKRSIEIKHKGSKLVLQSSFGTQARDILNAGEQTEPRLVFVDKNGILSHDEGFDEKSVVTYYMEVYLPNIYKNQNLSIGSDVWINDPVYSNLMGFRIPSTELHSAVPLKVKGFYPSTYGDNIVIAPKELVVLHGSDFDIDSLYTINKFVANKDIISPDGRQIAYEGVAVGYRNSKGGTVPLNILRANQSFPEWIAEEIDRVNSLIPNQDVSEPWKNYLGELEGLLPQAASNEILNTFMETISAEENMQDMMSPISMAVFNDIEDENSVFSVFANLLSQKETGKSLPAIPQRSAFPSDKMYSDALKGWTNNAMKYIRPSRNLNLLDDEVEMHQDNFRASLGTGIAANSFKIISYIFMGATNMKDNTNLSESEQPLPSLKEKFHLNIDGYKYDKFNRYIVKNGKLQDSGEGRTTTFQVIDSIINAAIDHVKEQILNVVNISNKTINGYISMIAMGIDPVTTSLFTTQPVLREMSNRSSDRNALNNLTSELRQGLLKNFGSESYIDRYNEILQNEELTPRERSSDIKKLATSYFNNISKIENFDEIAITKAELESAFKIDYNPDAMTKKQILFQMKILSEFRKVDLLGDALFRGSRALSSIRQVPSDFAKMQNILRLYDTFFDVDAAITNADPNRVQDIPVNQRDSSPFTNVDLSSVPNISASLNVIDEVMTATGKIFPREGVKMLDFSNRINSYMLGSGVENMQQESSEEDVNNTEETDQYAKQFDRGFLDWNAAKSLQRIRQNFVEYLMSGINFELPSGKVIEMSVSNEIPLEYSYPYNYTNDEGQKETETRQAIANGVTAWVRRFINTGIETEKGGKSVRLKSIEKLIAQYGFNAKTPNNFLSNLSIRYTAKTRTPYLSFAMGTSLDNVEKVDYENQFEKLRNLSIYETLDGKDIEPEVLADGEYNELQYNLLKYDILANGLSFGSYSYSQVMSIPIFRQVSKQLDNLMEGLLDEKNPKFDISKSFEHFALQLALMNVDKVRNIGTLVQLDKERNPVFGYDETYNIYYDMIVKDYASSMKAGDLPRFARRGQTLYVRVNSDTGKESPHVYYQRVERFNETKSFSFSPDILYSDNGYKIKDYFSPSKLAVSALEIKKGTTSGRFLVDIDPRFEPKARLAKEGDVIMIHSPSDFSRMNAEDFKVVRGQKGTKNGKEMVTLILERTSSHDVAEDFMRFSISEAERANKEIRETQEKIKKGL